jgi:hypothetical protein
MNPRQAREVLLLYRRGSNDQQDPHIGTALDAARGDEELRSWMERQTEFHDQVRLSIRRIKPPNDLKARILAARLPEKKIIWWKRPELMALAAALVMLGSLLVFWMRSAGGVNRFETYHARMAKTALREYRMNMLANDQSHIQSYLAEHGHPARFELPEKLQKLSGAGCALLRWNDYPVSLVCLRQPNQELLWLFVTKADTFKIAPGLGKPEFRQAGKLATAMWTRQGMTFILGGIGDRSLVERYL